MNQDNPVQIEEMEVLKRDVWQINKKEDEVEKKMGEERVRVVTRKMAKDLLSLSAMVRREGLWVGGCIKKQIGGKYDDNLPYPWRVT